MQMPSWARRMPGQTPTPKPKQKAKPAAPTIRDDAWWVERMKAWREQYPEIPMPKGKLAFWLALDVEQRPNDGEPTTPTNLDTLLDRFVEGESMIKLAEYVTELLGFRVSHAHLRSTITATVDGVRKYNLARQHVAHRLTEEALTHAEDALRNGDFRAAIDAKTKLAAKLNPAEYGDKSQLEIGGIRGGVPIESNVTQTPAEAYKAAIAGGAV